VCVCVCVCVCVYAGVLNYETVYHTSSVLVSRIHMYLDIYILSKFLRTLDRRMLSEVLLFLSVFDK